MFIDTLESLLLLRFYFLDIKISFQHAPIS